MIRKGTISLLIVMLLVLSTMLCCLTDVQAQTVSGEVQLTDGKTYQYDLNKDGKKEKIRYQTKEIGSYKINVKLYINEKKVYDKTLDGSLGILYSICDFDTKDKYLDLVMTDWSDSGCLNYAYFQRYITGNIKTQEVITPQNHIFGNADIYRISGLEKIKGDGTFAIVADSPMDVEIGSYFCYVPFTYENGVVKAQNVNTYTPIKAAKEYKYVLKKEIKVYKTSELNSKVSFHLKSGDSFQIGKIYIPKFNQTDATSSPKAFISIKDNKGRTGWIYADHSIKGYELFEQFPAWG